MESSKLQNNQLLGSIPPGRLTAWKIFLVCFLIAAVLIAVCSKSSPVYSINDWGDANAYVTVARMMLNGRTLYQDI